MTVKDIYDTILNLTERGFEELVPREMVDGTPVPNPTTGLPSLKPDDIRKCRCWNARIRRDEDQAGFVDIEFPENPEAQKLEAIILDAGRIQVYQMSKALEDEEGNTLPLETTDQYGDPMHRRGHSVLALVCRRKRTKSKNIDKVNPRDHVYERLVEEIQDMEEFDLIAKGEDVYKFLAQEQEEPEKAEQLFANLRYVLPSSGGGTPTDEDSIPSKPEQVVFIKAASGINSLWVNPRATRNIPAEQQSLPEVGTQKGESIYQ